MTFPLTAVNLMDGRGKRARGEGPTEFLLCGSVVLNTVEAP